MHVKVFVSKNSELKYNNSKKKNPAVLEYGKIINGKFVLPSVLQADPEMIVDFALNLLKNLKIVVNEKKNEISLITNSTI
jgi:hypothetical protein